eukprot:CAMPEP_0115189934 /NCGR_PEP_ID=MMETSP0270-20121206/11769_1 /TAXON_ID=71861 /ORGANISM="Scrippsiella trochoidea, Strain CCMP3099" /LENGTH=39 /DNA_ID= /DNA_START= /DNA_END= /DNA_ORIENTATION=
MGKVHFHNRVLAGAANLDMSAHTCNDANRVAPRMGTTAS